jgi:hypothetical protein
MNLYQGPLRGYSAVCFDLLLLIQFPLLHSFLLSRGGRAALASVFPQELGKHLVTTTFVMCASVQLLLLFGL